MVRHSTRPASAPEREIPAPGALPEDQRARRQRIVDAARHLMATVDYSKIQVKDVAEEANVSLGTLYRYFSSKDHLFACALADWAAPMDAELRERQRRSRDRRRPGCGRSSTPGPARSRTRRASSAR
jgi:AcrR family transcriptional regulator